MSTHPPEQSVVREEALAVRSLGLRCLLPFVPPPHPPLRYTVDRLLDRSHSTQRSDIGAGGIERGRERAWPVKARADSGKLKKTWARWVALRKHMKKSKQELGIQRKSELVKSTIKNVSRYNGFHLKGRLLLTHRSSARLFLQLETVSTTRGFSCMA